MQIGKDIMSLNRKTSKRVEDYGYFRLSKLSDSKILAKNLRYEDKREILSASGTLPIVAISYGISESDLCFTICNVQDIPIAIFGVNKVGAIWFLATPEIEKISIPFLRECRGVVDTFNKKYPLLWNYVDARNDLHIKWLKFCGFKFIRKLNYGVLNQPFYEIAKLCVNQ